MKNLSDQAVAIESTVQFLKTFPGDDCIFTEMKVINVGQDEYEVDFHTTGNFHGQVKVNVQTLFVAWA